MEPLSDLPEPASITRDLAHLAFCALVALGLARQDNLASTPYAENLFLIRWLATAQKQKRFPRNVATDIVWLLNHGRQYGAAGKLRQRLEYLWKSCTGEVDAQSDLFRLTYATETLNTLGWNNFLLTSRQWKSDCMPVPGSGNSFYVEKTALHGSFNTRGQQICPLIFHIAGQLDEFISVMSRHRLTFVVTDTRKDYAVLMLHPESPERIP